MTNAPDWIDRVPIDNMPSKSRVATYRFPGGGGLMWAVAAARDSSLDMPDQAREIMRIFDGMLAAEGIDKRAIVKCEVVTTDHDRKPEFDEVWKEWMPAGCGPVRSFVESKMPEGDLVELIITAALPPEED